MKKTLLTACLILATTSMSFAATNVQTKTVNNQVKPPQQQNIQRPPKRPNLEQQLNLTEEQKIQAKAIREQGHEQMKPIMDSLKSKEEQKRLLMKNQSAGVKEVKKLEQLNSDIVKLRQQAKNIREKNNKQFEAILTDTQKEQFNQMKKEGRREFEKRHAQMGLKGPMPQCKGGFRGGPQNGFPPKGSFPPPPPLEEK